MPVRGFGFDIDPNAVALANANAKLAGVGDRCRFEVADVKDFAPRPSSIILTNPPYGERLAMPPKPPPWPAPGPGVAGKPHRRIVCHYGGC